MPPTMTHERTKPLIKVRMMAPYQFMRVAPIEAIVVHSTQGHNRPGVGDLESLGYWWRSDQNPWKTASHVATDDDGFSARYVPDDKKCYHAGVVNGITLGIEQIGFAEQTSWAEKEIAETARWVARWNILHGIPIQHGRYNSATGHFDKRGTVEHAEVPGSHWDCGDHYPLKDVLLPLAREFRDRLKHPTFAGNISLGDRGENVKVWQRQMKNRGWTITVDGIFGSQSRIVLKSFQRKSGLDVVGYVNKASWNAAWEHPFQR